ncbi:MAG: hypothetical protein H0U76_27970 [Ktedonobacteraceae bacterium]|nr:hypothetical protein [Ktedonobacteraceae bacterium]MBA3824700.1 hypothetical protein [Ktedonobacterales bacterium]
MDQVVPIAKHVLAKKLDDGNVRLWVTLGNDFECAFGLSGEAVAALQAFQADDLVGYCLNHDCAVQEAVTASQAGRLLVYGTLAWVCPNCAAPLSPPQFPF